MTHSWLWWWVDDEIVDPSVLTSQKNIDNQESDISAVQVLLPAKEKKSAGFENFSDLGIIDMKLEL